MPNRSYNNGNTDSRFKFTGQELDQELDINLYYFGARYYDPALAKWTSVDPLADKYTDMSPNNYCGNEPINKYDPDGRDFFEKVDNWLHDRGWRDDTVEENFEEGDYENATYQLAEEAGINTNEVNIEYD